MVRGDKMPRIASRFIAALAGGVALLAASQAMAGAKIAVITPYLAQPGTQFYVEAFQDQAKANGWTVNVVDTKGDVAAAISRIEDAANDKVDAIVINVDPAQVAAGLETAKKAGIPVFGMDAGARLRVPWGRAGRGQLVASRDGGDDGEKRLKDLDFGPEGHVFLFAIFG